MYPKLWRFLSTFMCTRRVQVFVYKHATHLFIIEVATCTSIHLPSFNRLNLVSCSPEGGKHNQYIMCNPEYQKPLSTHMEPKHGTIFLQKIILQTMWLRGSNGCLRFWSLPDSCIISDCSSTYTLQIHILVGHLELLFPIY